ncbi:hypothetical protein [Pseudoduganella sp. OTU4001]|uniref:hypothetical protein n=1 Tax=Pseudoduganella sp. OTU4001 TaxID=3043854 RepID=UPI00313DEFFB
MTTDQLVFISSWASIISLVVAVISLLLVRSIKTNIIRFRRKQRLKELASTISDMGKGVPASDEFDSIFDSLRRNFPLYRWSNLTKRGRLVIALHQRIDLRDLRGIKEVLKDISSYSEDI